MGRWLPALFGVLLLVTACAAGPTHVQPPAAPSYVPPVDCGLVTGPAGKRDVVSPALPAGTADCGEVLNVLYAYYRDAPHKAQGTARRLVVNGWTCEADLDDRNASQVGCDKNGLAFLTQTYKA